MDEFLRAKAIMKLLSISKSTLYRWINEGHFPEGRLLGPRVRVWPMSVVLEFVSTKLEIESPE